MASASSLIRTEVRRVSSAKSKGLGRITKFTGGKKAKGRIRLGQPISPKGFPAFPPVSTLATPVAVTRLPPTITRGVATAPLAGPLGQPTGLPTIGVAGLDFSGITSLCGLIPDERLRILCEAGVGLFPEQRGRTTPLVDGTTDGCDPGFVKFGTQCIDPGAILPGGDPLFQPDFNGEVVRGGFGLPATTPEGVSRITRKCPRGMVLGIDNLCYAKAILPARSLLRKWKRPPRPPISRRDTVAIRRAAGARDRVFELAKDVGLHVAKSPHRKKAKT